LEKQDRLEEAPNLLMGFFTLPVTNAKGMNNVKNVKNLVTGDLDLSMGH
jgi:hypothetical protein